MSNAHYIRLPPSFTISFADVLSAFPTSTQSEYTTSRLLLQMIRSTTEVGVWVYLTYKGTVKRDPRRSYVTV